METTNNIQFNAKKFITYNGIKSIIYVKIRLNDKCRNGHEDFSITGDIYENRTGSKSDKYFVIGGCIHEEILKYFPQFKIFVDLHLCDFKGIPMHPIANGFYHLQTGFERLNGKTQKEYFCEYYRITPDQYDIISKSSDKLEYALNLDKLGILDQWKEQADQAIKLLEELTGKKFESTATRTQLTMPKDETFESLQQKEREGYFSQSEKGKRLKAKIDSKHRKIINDIEQDYKKSIQKAEYKRNIGLLIFNKVKDFSESPKYKHLDFYPALNNMIFYDHSMEIKFNWKSYEKQLSLEAFDLITGSITDKELQTLPQNVKINLGDIRTWEKKEIVS